MSKEQHELDKEVLQLIYSDLELLELSISDLAIALGGNPNYTRKSYFNKLKSGKLLNCFNRTVRNKRNYKYYKIFKGLDLQVDSFIRIIKLHIDRGFTFLLKFSKEDAAIKLFCLCYVDVAFDLYDGVLKQLVTFSLHDCVYLYKFFVKFDNTLLSYKIKHVYIRDEIYDLILNSLWYALKDAWWLYLDTKWLKSIFPFVAHMKVEGQYQATIHDLNHVLHNIHFVTLISQDVAFQSETQTLMDSQSNRDEIESLYQQQENKKNKFRDLNESDLEIDYVRSVDTFNVNPKNETTDLEDNVDMEMDEMNIGNIDVSNNMLNENIRIVGNNGHNGNGDSNDNIMQNSSGLNFGFGSEDISNVLDFSHLKELGNNLDMLNEVNWSQVIYVSLVGFIYIVLFESYLNVIVEALNADMEPEKYVEFLVKRLQDLIQVHNLIVEVDINFTAWAHDKLGNWSDVELLKCFNTYSESLFSEDEYRDNHLFSYRGDSMKNDLRKRLGNQRSEVSMYLLAPALERLQKIQYHVVLRIATVCARPVLKLIEEIYLVEESKLYYDVLYSQEGCLIGPRGALSQNCTILPLTFKRAVFVETYFIIIKSYAKKLMDTRIEVCESIFFDSMSLWDSVIDYFDFSANPEMVEQECVKLVANILDQIKFTPNIDLNPLDNYKRNFRLNFFSRPRGVESMLSTYTYDCLYHVGYIRRRSSSSGMSTEGSNHGANANDMSGSTDGNSGSVNIVSSKATAGTSNFHTSVTMDNQGHNMTTDFGYNPNSNSRNGFGISITEPNACNSNVFVTGNTGSSSNVFGVVSGTRDIDENNNASSSTPYNLNPPTNSSTTFAPTTANAYGYFGSSAPASRGYSGSSNGFNHVGTINNKFGVVTAPTTLYRNVNYNRETYIGITRENVGHDGNTAGSWFRFGIGANKTGGVRGDTESSDGIMGQDSYLDKYLVWLDGVRKKRMLILGNLILFFRENSLLQPAGFITFDSIYSILSPNSVAQVHPNVQILENNSENDSFSCGTSKSSSSASSSSSVSPRNNFSNVLRSSSSSSVRCKHYLNPARNHYSTMIHGVNIPAKSGSRGHTSPNNNSYTNSLSRNYESYGSKTITTPETSGTPFKTNIANRVFNLGSVSKRRIENLPFMKPYLPSPNPINRLPKGSSVASKTRYSTNSAMFENMAVWGWQIRLELFDSCVLDDMNSFNLDIEFMGPEFRRFWEQHIRAMASAKSHYVSWPYHSFFFDSI